MNRSLPVEELCKIGKYSRQRETANTRQESTKMDIRVMNSRIVMSYWDTGKE